MMKMKVMRIGAALAVAGFAAVNVLADRATVVEGAIWSGGRLFGTVATVTSFKSPPPHSTDIIFSFDQTVLSGQRSVSEAAPGDRDYNGGRWHVYSVTYTDLGLATLDADDNDVVDFEVMDVGQVMDLYDLGLIEIIPTDTYFECPLRPNK